MVVPDVDPLAERDSGDSQMSIRTARRGQRLIVDGWFASHADSGTPGPHVRLRSSDGQDPVVRTDQVPHLVEALGTVAERIERQWAVEGDDYAEHVVLRSPDPQDLEVARRQARVRLTSIQRIHERLPEVVHLLLRADSTDDALVSIAALLDVDEVDVMVHLARFNLLAMTVPATDKRLREIDDLGD